MKRKKVEGATSLKTQSASSVRASISFPPNLYATLAEIARRKKVPVAWVVRDAAEQYIAGAANEVRGGRLRQGHSEG